jgi:hypothetical protein
MLQLTLQTRKYFCALTVSSSPSYFGARISYYECVFAGMDGEEPLDEVGGLDGEHDLHEGATALALERIDLGDVIWWWWYWWWWL